MSQPGLDLRELPAAGAEIRAQAAAIYQQSFPPDEREPLETLLAHGADRPATHYWAAVEDQTVWGIAFFSYFPRTRMSFLAYIAVRPDLRGGGFGARLYQRMLQQAAEDARVFGQTALGAALEVEKPALAASPAERDLRQRRIQFYQRLGAFIVDGIDFIAPPLSLGASAMPYHILFHPLALPGALNAEHLRQIVRTTLGFGYRLSPQNPYYRRALRSIHPEG